VTPEEHLGSVAKTSRDHQLTDGRYALGEERSAQEGLDHIAEEAI